MAFQKEANTTDTTSVQHQDGCKLQLDQIPEYIRADVGRVLLRGFMDSIREHPEKVDEYNRLGRDFLERIERKAQNGKGGKHE